MGRKIFNYSSEILTQETIDRFGHNPENLGPSSAKFVIARCRFCGENMEVRKGFFNKSGSACHRKCRLEEQKRQKSPFSDPIVMAKTRKTNIERYGVEHPCQNGLIAKKMSDIKMSEEYKNKIKQTIIEKYGVDNVAKSPEIREKIRASKILGKDIFGSYIEENIGNSNNIECLYCKKKFHPKHSYNKYCSKECSGLSKRKRVVRNCLNCGKELSIKSCMSDVKKYCSYNCTAMHKRVREEKICTVCGKKFYPAKITSKCCSIECKYKSYPRKGYKEIYLKTLSESDQELFSKMFSKNFRCHEHRFIMAKHVGRPLDSNEIVHHLNGDRRDNRLENLELLTNKSHHHTAFGDVYYQRWQEAESKIRDLELKIKELEQYIRTCSFPSLPS